MATSTNKEYTASDTSFFHLSLGVSVIVKDTSQMKQSTTLFIINVYVLIIV